MSGYTTRPLDETSWDLFAELVDRNNGVFGGCWCVGFHPRRPPGVGNREAKRQRVRDDETHAALVVDEDGVAQGWAQYGDPDELAAIKHGVQYRKDAPPRPDWRITCVFVDKAHRGRGVARAAVDGALGLIGAAGGGLVEVISETTAGRTAQSRFLFSATAELWEDVGFTRVRQVGKHAWILSRQVSATPGWAGRPPGVAGSGRESAG